MGFIKLMVTFEEIINYNMDCNHIFFLICKAIMRQQKKNLTMKHALSVSAKQSKTISVIYESTSPFGQNMVKPMNMRL